MFEVLVWSCWLTPIIGFLLAPFLINCLKRVGIIIQPIYALLSAIMSTFLALEVFSHGSLHSRTMWIPQLGLNLGVYVDALSAIMINVVSWVAFLIMVYSVKYMEHEPGLVRFWMMMNLFVGSMLLLVLSDNFIQMFIGWELVGVTSYSLIGHYYTDEKKYWVLNYPPTHCSMKAFVITKIGDLFMLIGALIIYLTAGTLSFPELFRNTSWINSLSEKGLLLPVLLCLFLGPVGKSAQFPLHEWLPEAMAGPTPVSALIHAATMVKAGVYFMARILPLVHYAAWSLGCSEAILFFYIVALIGSFTAFLAATQALVARELKRILAYSTISQIGYMMLGLGSAGLVGNYLLGLIAAVLHLINHALFKATLFLASGVIIHVCETKDVLEMGGIRRELKVTFICTLISALALSGVPPFSGFWSKDLVLSVSMLSGRVVPFLLGTVTSALTIFYSLRMIGLVFFGEKSEHLRSLERKGHRIHEIGPSVYIPYLLLTVLTLIMSGGAPFFEKAMHHVFSHDAYYLTPALHVTDQKTITSLMVPMLSVIMLVIGAMPSYFAYITRRINVVTLMNKYVFLKSLHTFLWNRWYINGIYYKLFVNSLLRLSLAIYSGVEIKTLEGLNRWFVEFVKSYSGKLATYIELATFERFNVAVSSLFKIASRFVRKLQTGYLSYNISEMVIGLVLLILLSLLITFGGVRT